MTKSFDQPYRSSIDSINDVRIKLECYVNFALQIVFARRASPHRPHIVLANCLRSFESDESYSTIRTV